MILNRNPITFNASDFYGSNGNRLDGMTTITVQYNPAYIQDIKTVNITTNGTTTVLPDTGKEFMESVEINTNVQPTLESKTVNVSSNGQLVINADQGYDGLSTVTVNTNVPDTTALQSNKTVNITQNGLETVGPDMNYDGFENVIINTNVQPNLESKTLTVTSNQTQTIIPTTGYDGISRIDLTTDVQPNLENKILTITSNGTQTVVPTTGYDGISSVSITTDIPYTLPTNIRQIFSQLELYRIQLSTRPLGNDTASAFTDLSFSDFTYTNNNITVNYGMGTIIVKIYQGVNTTIYGTDYPVYQHDIIYINNNDGNTRTLAVSTNARYFYKELNAATFVRRLRADVTIYKSDGSNIGHIHPVAFGPEVLNQITSPLTPSSQVLTLYLKTKWNELNN